jgi:glycosyltransferase involved in cell wall biosynthesis
VIEKKYLKSVDGFIFNSQTTREVVDKLIGNDKPHVIGYPPTDRFGDPMSENEIIERAKRDELKILFLGNVIHRKGLHVLLEAVKGLESKASVDIVGSLDFEPEYARRMQTYVIKHDLSSLVSFHSSLDKEFLIDKLRSAHVLVVPSSYEGYGIVYLEGMGFGLPAVGTTAGAAREIITDGVDGFLIEPGDPDLLVSRLRVLQADRELLVRMSLAARERYLRQPKWDETAGHIREFLRSFLG